jgi:hypothetical protein
MPTFLPIVARELCVAARKRSSYWVRIVAALIAVVLGTGFLILSRVTFGLLPFSPGSGLFGALTWLCFFVCLAAGLFLTSDCLSEEKRAGTMGFLFLTDLRGYDVICGKLLATSLRGACAILGVLPILAVTLLMGGVTGGEFFKTSLALCNALFLSLVAGLFVSMISRESQKALNGTLLLLIALVFAGPVGDRMVASIRQSAVTPILSLSSPGYLFLQADAWSSNLFLRSLMVNQVLGWSLLALTCLFLPRSWQDKGGTAARSGRFVYLWKFGGPKRRARLRARLMDVNPVLWLACRERWQALSVWVLATALATVVAAICISDKFFLLWMVWGQASGLLTLLLYLGFASQSARFFVEAQRNGLELLLATPLTVPQIIRGQWQALRRMLGLPIALFLAAECVGGFVSQEYAWNHTTTTPPRVIVPTNAPPLNSSGTNRTVTLKTGSLAGATFSGSGFSLPPRVVLIGIAVASTGSVLANFIALVWFGMWMGLTSKSLNLATLKTLLWVQIVPWFVLSFATLLMIPLLMMSAFMKGRSPGPQMMTMWFPWLAAGVGTMLSLLKDLGFSLWARRKLYAEFRLRATQAVVPIRATAPPVLAAVEPPPRVE